MATLSIVVPCFNSAAYMRHGIDSLLTAGDSVEIVIVDDGSTDCTAAIADEYAERFPGIVRAVHTPNGGHGSAVNTGIDAATGAYLKVVDSDDWVDAAALARVIETLDDLLAGTTPPDLLVSNFVYEKAGKRYKRAVRYRNALPRGRVFGWDEFGRFRHGQYMLMHALTYRTQLLRESGLRLPAHTFYVDNLYASIPLRRVRTMFYLDVDLYRYYIGRPDQSVNEAVMIRRIDQQLRVTNLMQQELPSVSEVHPRMHAYLVHYFSIVSAVTCMMLIRSGTREDIARKAGFWEQLRAEHPALYRRLRRSALGRILNLPGRAGRRTSVTAYQVARWVVGFN
jgi:glycosyltransferase involved in cell wall biosynthesis